MNNLDSRLHAFDDPQRRAEVALQGQLAGDDWQWVTPRRAVTLERTTLKAQPDVSSAQVTEALPGERVEVLWQDGDWWRARTLHDGYLGWLNAAQVALDSDWKPDLTVQALRAHAFAGPKVSRELVAELCLGTRLKRGAGEAAVDERRRWLPVVLPDGRDAWVQEIVFQPLAQAEATSLALRFLETPYVWGGRSAWGLDCSGLTQTVYAALGHRLPRDADQQQEATRPVEAPQSGDLAFFPGHVGLMLDNRRLIHANANNMRVTIETLGEGDYGERLAAALSGFGRVS